MKAESLYIQKLTYDENTGNEIIGLFTSEDNPVIVSSYTYDAKRMGGAPTLTATIYSSEPLQWKKEEFVEYNGDRFFASYTPNSTKDNSSRMWKSEITFTSRRELLDNTLFFDVVVDDVDTQNKDRYRSNQTKFTFGGTIYDFVARINSSMAYCGLYRPTDEYNGYYVVVDEGYGTDEVKEVSFEDQYLTDVLQLINTTFELDYYWDGNVCHVGNVQHDLTDTPIKYGCSDALISVSKENANYKIVDMITGYGSSDNLPYYYPNDDEFGEAVFDTENISKNNVSVDLSKLQNTFGAGNAYNKKFVLSRLSTSEFSKLFVVKRNVSEKGQAYDDDPTQRGDNGELLISAKFLCLANCKIDLSNLQVNTSFDGDSGISCDFSSIRFEIVKNGISEIKNSLDNKFVCDQDGVYEFRAYTTYQFYCGTRLPEGVDFYNGIAYLSLDGNVTISYQGDGSDYVCTEDGSIQVKTSECGILFQNTTDSMYATSSLVEYISQEEGIDGGVKMSAIENTENAASVIVTDRIWLYPSSVLLPSIYRKTGGAERFYYALNNTHKLPSGSGYYEFVNLYKKGNPHQGTVTFDDIKPTINGIVNAEGQLFGEIADVAFDKEDSDVKDSDGNYIHSYFYLKLHKFNGDFGFDLFSHALASESAKINIIKSNGCPACSFVIYNQPSADNSKCYNCVSVDENGNLKQVRTDKNDYIFANASDAYEDKLNQDSTQKELWIAVQKDTSTLGIVMPNASAGFKPQKGDLFVITGIKPPKVLVTEAEKRLDDALIKHMSENNTDQFNYSVKFSRIFLQENPDFASKLNENAKLSIQIQGDSDRDGNLISHEVFVSNYSVKVDNDELAEVEVELVNSLEVTKSDVKQIIDSVKGETVKSLSSMVGGSNTNSFNASITDKMYLSKLKDDTAHGTITFEKVQKFLKGLNIGEGNGTWSSDGTLSLFKLLTNNFDSGPYGHGAQIDEKGDMEVNSIYARQFISAPKFVFNEISVTKAEQWNTNGYGTIESVDVKNRTITLHLEENDYGSLQVGDICRGLYADIDNAHGADKIEEGALDDCNFVQHKGFFSTYFYVMHIITNEKGKFVFQYGKKSAVTPDPCAYMDFAQYGSFTDEKRQSSMYFSSRGNSFIEVLDGVKTWEVQSQNRVARYGWLGGLLLVKKDGSTVRPEGNGIYVQDNIYFGGNINYLQGLSGLDDLREEAKAYDVSLSQYQSVITVDDMGNVINGLYTEDEEKTTKQYRISTAVFVRKGMDILLEEDGNTEDVTAGHYRVHAVSEDCEVMVQNSTIFVTAIRNIKDGVAGTTDDANFDYDAMRKATDAMVTIVVELEGKTSKLVQMPIRIQHDTLPFMVCDLSNESASVAWNTKTAKYIGLPIKTKVSLLYHNEPWAISSLNISNVAGLKTSMSIEGKAKVITIDADNLTADTLVQVTKMNITVVGRYAGANYEYTRELTILKSSDTVVYELIPSADSIVVDKDGNKTVNSVSCDVYATSSDDKRYKLTALPSGMSLKYGKSENATKDLVLGAGVDVTSDDKMVTFALYDKNNQILDKESVPVLAFGKDGKGIEYIFKLQNTAPSNPTPSDYATNTEYQRTDQEFIPDGWTDDPTGVDAVNQYEWVSKRVSTNGHWGAFSEPAEYAHFGKHAAKATLSDYIVTIPTDSEGNALSEFSEDISCTLLVDGKLCSSLSVSADSIPSGVTISGTTINVSYAKGYALGRSSKVVNVKVSGKLDNASYSDTITLTILPNVSGVDGDGYEYIYYQSSSSSASSIPTPRRQNGSLTNDWQDDPMPPTVDEQYVYVAYKKGVVGSDGTFSAPKLFNRFPKSIANQETKFYAHSSLSPAPDASTILNSGSTSMPSNFSDDKPWLWKIIRTTYTDGTTSDVVSCEGYKAKDGIGITSVNTWYGLSKSMASQPSSFTYNTLSKVVIETYANDYVWSADKVTYTNNDEAFTGIYCIGKCSDLTSVTEQYGTSTSYGTKPGDNDWSDKYPENAPKGTYIWSRDKIVWKDGKTTYSDAQLIGYIATDGKHAPKASSTDDIVTIPTDSNGNALVEFSDDIHFSLRVDGISCRINSVIIDSANTTNVSYSISGNTASISCAEGARIGMVAQTIVFKVTGTLDGSSYSDYVTVKVVPNVTGSDGDGYEYIYYQSSSSSASSIPTPRRQNGNLSDDWVDDPPSPTDDKRYVYVSYFKGKVGTPNVPSTQWSPPALWTYKAPKGDKGNPGDKGDKGNPGDKGDKGDDGKDGVGIVTAYQRASAIPAKKPEVTNYNTYKDVDDLGNKWQKSAPTSNDDLFEGGSISGTVLYNQKVNGGNWQSGVSDGGFTWYKSPTVANNGIATMQIHFTTTEDNQYVTFYLKAYSEKTYDLVLLSKIDSAEVSKSNYSAQTSGEGVEISVKLKCDKAGQHFVTVAYTKDGTNDMFGDYGLVRMATTENYVQVDVTADSLDGDIIAGKNITSGNYALVKGGSISGTPNLVNAANWRTSYYDSGNLWYKSPTVADNGIATMQIHFTTTANNQYVTFYLKAYSEKNRDFILLSDIDSTEIDRTGKFSFRASGDGVEVNAKLKCGKAGQHFVTVAYAKDESGKLADDKDFGLVRMDTTDNYVWVYILLYRCDGEVASDKTITWGNIYQAMGDKGEKGDKGDKGESGASGGRGTRGPIPRTHKGAESGSYTYLQGADNEEYVDLVYDKESATWYRCIKTYTTSSPSIKDTNYWESSQTKGWTFMATELLLAENARIDMLSSQEINLLSDKSTLFGSFRHVTDDNDYAFWIGGKTGAAATTSITKGGKLKTTNADITGKITATSGQIGGFKLEDNNLVCSNARLAIGEESNTFTRMVVLDAKSYVFDNYNFALSVVNYGIVTQSSATQAGIHIKVGASNASVQYPGIVMENGTFVGFRVPVVPLSYSMDLRNNAAIYASGMCIRCNNPSDITITLPTSATGAKTGDVFTVIRAGTGDVTIKAPAGVSYRTSNGKTGEFTSIKKDEQIHLIFDGDTWFSECSAG